MTKQRRKKHTRKQSGECQSRRKYDLSAAIWPQMRMPVRQPAGIIEKTLRSQIGGIYDDN
jgi:hypothetical protein